MLTMKFKTSKNMLFNNQMSFGLLYQYGIWEIHIEEILLQEKDLEEEDEALIRSVVFQVSEHPPKIF